MQKVIQHHLSHLSDGFHEWKLLVEDSKCDAIFTEHAVDLLEIARIVW